MNSLREKNLLGKNTLGPACCYAVKLPVFLPSNTVTRQVLGINGGTTNNIGPMVVAISLPFYKDSLLLLPISFLSCLSFPISLSNQDNKLVLQTFVLLCLNLIIKHTYNKENPLPPIIGASESPLTIIERTAQLVAFILFFLNHFLLNPMTAQLLKQNKL